MLKYILLKTIVNNKWQTGKYVYPASRKATLVRRIMFQIEFSTAFP